MSLNVAANLSRMSAKDLDAFTKYVTNCRSFAVRERKDCF